MPIRHKSGTVNILALLKSIAIGAVLLFLLLMVLKDPIIKVVAERTGSSALGAKLVIGNFSWNMITSVIRIKDIKVDHPPGFEAGMFVHIPEVVVSYDPKALMGGNWHMPLVSLDLKEMFVIKNAEGKLNVDALKMLHPPDEKETAETQTAAAPPAFMIDELKLNVGQVIYKDYFKKPTPNILVYHINFKNRIIKNIDSVPKLVGGIIVQAVKKTALQGAGIYAAAAVMGAGFLPGAVLGVVVAKDDAVDDFPKRYGQMFDACMKFIKERGTVVKFDEGKGTIEGKVDGVSVKVKLEKISWNKTRVIISARKLMLPKREFAGGLLYQIGQTL